MRGRWQSVVGGLLGVAAAATWPPAPLRAAESAAAMPEVFRYQNCADRSAGMVLGSCDFITIRRDFSNVAVTHLFEAGLPMVGDADFLALSGRMVPIALPRAGYATRDRWEFAGRTYVKVHRNLTLRPFRQPVDTIAVFPSAEVDSRTDFTARASTGPFTLIFAYSPADGVVAIAIPDGRNGDATVYSCVDSPCLFAADLALGALPSG